MTTKTDELKPCPFCGCPNIHITPDEVDSGGQWVGPVHVVCGGDCVAGQTGDDRESAIAAWNRRQAAMPADAWQPIETAPKNTEVLVWREDSGPFIAKLTDPYEVITVEEMERDDLEFPDDYEEWWSDAYGWQEGSERPTHWVPLPAAPGLQSQDHEGAPSIRKAIDARRHGEGES